MPVSYTHLQGIHCFLNGVLDDNLMIYYGEFHHETERAIFEKLRTSPYRNYVSRSYYKDCPIVYLMGIDLTERMQALYDALGEASLLEQVKEMCIRDRGCTAALRYLWIRWWYAR